MKNSFSLIGLTLAITQFACGSSDTGVGDTGHGGAATSGGAPANGGAPASSGGTPTTSGGNLSGGTSFGGASLGGAPANGGSPSSGGTTSGGAPSLQGGAAGVTGGSSSGGAPVSGGSTSNGGSSTGGAVGNGGSKSTGGSSSGGASSGGASSSGGSGTAGGTSMSCPFTNPVVGWASQSGTTTGGGNATPTNVNSLSALNNAAKGSNAAVIQITGTITGSVTVGSNKTLVGACGGQAAIKGHLDLSGSSNVIIRNLNIVGKNCTDSPSDCSAGEDAITITKSAKHVWFDHCDISDGSDGTLDITHGADLITISWTKFHYSGRRSGDHQFCNLIGHSDSNSSEDTGHLNVTFDHVWWADNVAQRMPRVRFGKVHVVNSLYTASGNDSGVGVGVSCNIRVENSAFVGIKDALYFANANSASIAESVNNSFSSSTGTSGRGTSFNPPYPYALDPLSAVPANVRAGAGTK